MTPPSTGPHPPTSPRRSPTELTARRDTRRDDVKTATTTAMGTLQTAGTLFAFVAAPLLAGKPDRAVLTVGVAALIAFGAAVVLHLQALGPVVSGNHGLPLDARSTPEQIATGADEPPLPDQIIWFARRGVAKYRFLHAAKWATIVGVAFTVATVITAVITAA